MRSELNAEKSWVENVALNRDKMHKSDHHTLEIYLILPSAQ